LPLQHLERLHDLRDKRRIHHHQHRVMIHLRLNDRTAEPIPRPAMKPPDPSRPGSIILSRGAR